MSRAWKPLPTHLPGWHTYAPPEPSEEQRKRNRKKLLALRARIKEKQRVARAKRNSLPKYFSSATAPSPGARPALPKGMPTASLATGVGSRAAGSLPLASNPNPLPPLVSQPQRQQSD